jgi:hypothetical protein
MTETMNGWSNWETHNVAYFLQNDWEFYSVALACGDYREFLAAIADSDVGLTTPDGVPWFSSAINHAEIDRMIEAF